MPPRIDPELAVEIMLAHGYRPKTPYAGAMAPWPSDCVAAGHPVTPRLANVRAGRSTCKTCAHELLAREQAVSLDEALEDLLRAGLEPLEDYPGSIHVRWRCRCRVCRTAVPVLIKSLRARGSGCRKCGNARKGSHKLVPADRAVARMQEAGLEPTEDYPGRTDAPWRCTCVLCGRTDTYLLNYVSRDVRRGGYGCVACRHEDRSVTQRRRKHPAAVVIMQDAGLTPLTLFPGRNVGWRCCCDTCGDEVLPRLGSILAGQGGCTRCGKRRGADKRRIPEDRARALMLRHGFDPIGPYEGYTTAWRSTCLTCGRTPSPTLADVLGGHGCLPCNGGHVEPEQAQRLFRAKGFVPLEKFPGGVRKPWKARHTCGKIVRPTLANVRRLRIGSGCSACADGGFREDAPSLVYVIEHPELDAGKIGIMNAGSRRIDVFRAQGWLLVGTVAVATGREARRVERAALDLVMGTGAQRIPPYLSSAEVRNGWKETFALAHTAGVEAYAVIRSVASAREGRAA